MDHLGSNVKKKVQTLIDKYDDVWARESRKTGTFKYFKVSLEVDSERLHVGMQKNRNTDFQRSPEARQVIQQLLKERVLIPAPSQVACVANFLLVPKSIKGGSKGIRPGQTKADKAIISDKDRQRMTYRLTVDFTSLNKILKGETQICLPSINTIKEKVLNCYISSCDISNGFWSIKMNENSLKYQGVWYEDKILCFAALVQGSKTSPHIFTKAVSLTFQGEILQEFLNVKKWKSFPYKDYSEFLTIFMDDILIRTKRDLGTDHHLNCVESAIYAIQRAGWLLSSQKLEILKEPLTFLGCSSRVFWSSSLALVTLASFETERSGITSSELSSSDESLKCEVRKRKLYLTYVTRTRPPFTNFHNHREEGLLSPRCPPISYPSTRNHAPTS